MSEEKIISKHGFFTNPKRSHTMQSIKSKNTKPEIDLRQKLWALGYRYRIHVDYILGKPDIVFPKEKIAIFVDGDFWHGYNWEEKKKKIKANREYWISKIEMNIKRDKDNNFQLKSNGWIVLRFWESEINNEIDKVINKILEAKNLRGEND